MLGALLNAICRPSRRSGARAEAVDREEACRTDLVVSYDERYRRVMLRWNTTALGIGLDADQAEELARVLVAKAEVLRRNP